MTTNPLHEPTITVVDGADGLTPEMLRRRKAVVLVDWNTLDRSHEGPPTIKTIYDKGLNYGEKVILSDFEGDHMDCIGVVVEVEAPRNPKAMIGDVEVYTFEVTGW